jgi:hypothetical protein
VKGTTSTRLRTKTARVKRLRRKRRSQQRAGAWARGLALTAGASGLIGAVGAPLLRLLAERCGLRAGLSAALGRLRPDFVPEYDRGQVLVDVAVALGLGAVSVAGVTDVLSASQAVLGQVASTPTAWRALSELDAAALAVVAKARAAHRRAMWARLAARPGGFPWVEVAEHAWTGWVVLDVDASLVESHSDKQGAAGTYKKHVFGLHPIIVSCANTGEILTVLLRPGNAGANTAADHIAVLSGAVAQLPAAYRKKIIFRADGAGSTKELLTWITAEAARRGYTWHYSVGFDVTPRRDHLRARRDLGAGFDPRRGRSPRRPHRRDHRPARRARRLARADAADGPHRTAAPPPPQTGQPHRTPTPAALPGHRPARAPVPET